jgi:hypothetical protein
MPEAAVSELMFRLAVAGSVVGIPVMLERLVPANRIASQRLLEALLIAAGLTTVAQGLIAETSARAVALGVIVFGALRVIRSPQPTDAAELGSRKRAHGDPLLTAVALAVGALVQPIGPASLFQGFGIVTAGAFIYMSANSRILANVMALGVLVRTAATLFA